MYSSRHLLAPPRICRCGEAKPSKIVRVFLTFNQENGRSLWGGRDQLREAIENAAYIAKFPVPFAMFCPWTALLECLRICVAQDLEKQLAAFVDVIIGTFKNRLC